MTVRSSGPLRRLSWSAVAVLAVSAAAFAACGGDDDGGSPFGRPSDSDTPASDSTAGSQQTATRPGSSATEKVGARAKLEVGSSATIRNAPDAGTVTMTITRIISPANDLLPAGLSVEPGNQLWAVEAKVEVKDGKETAIADFTVETAKGEYGFTGTASSRDLGYAFEQGTTEEGHVAFELPADEQVVRLRAEFSIYQGYDIVFER